MTATLPARLLAALDAADENLKGWSYDMKDRAFADLSDDLQRIRDEAAAALSGREAVAADWRMEVKSSATDAEILTYLDELLDVQGRLMFAKGNAPEPLGEVFGVAILDFMRLHGMRVREIISAMLAAAPSAKGGLMFSRHKLRGNWITWSFGRKWWLRIGRVILRAEYQRRTSP